MIKDEGFFEIDDETYHQDPVINPSLSSSIAKILANKTPHHAWYQHPRLNKNYKPIYKPNFDLGVATHSALLVGLDIVEVVDFPDWRTKAAKEARQAVYLRGKVPMLFEQAKKVTEMVEAAKEYVIDSVIDGIGNRELGSGEQTIVWREDDIWCRSKIDWLLKNKNIIVDYKTTTNANPAAFVRNISELGYDIQAAFYLRGIRHLTDTEYKFVWLIQEDTPPYACSLASPDEEMLEYGILKVSYAIDLWRLCMNTGLWHGYNKDIFHCSTTRWDAQFWDDKSFEIV